MRDVAKPPPQPQKRRLATRAAHRHTKKTPLAQTHARERPERGSESLCERCRAILARFPYFLPVVLRSEIHMIGAASDRSKHGTNIRNDEFSPKTGLMCDLFSHTCVRVLVRRVRRGPTLGQCVACFVACPRTRLSGISSLRSVSHHFRGFVGSTTSHVRPIVGWHTPLTQHCCALLFPGALLDDVAGDSRATGKGEGAVFDESRR